MASIYRTRCTLCGKWFHTRYDVVVCPDCLKTLVAPDEDLSYYERHIIYRKLCMTYPRFVNFMRRHAKEAFLETLNRIVTQWECCDSFITGEKVYTMRDKEYADKELEAAVNCIVAAHSNDIILRWASRLSKADATALCNLMGDTDRMMIANMPVFADRSQIKCAWEYTHNSEIEMR